MNTVKLIMHLHNSVRKTQIQANDINRKIIDTEKDLERIKDENKKINLSKEIENLKKEKEKILSNVPKEFDEKNKKFKELSKDYKNSLNTYYQTVDHRLR